MVKNFIWDTIGRAGTQAVSLFCSFLLTRLLDPVDFGLAGIAITWLFIVSILLDLGFSRALIQHKDPTKDEYTSVFTMQLLAGLFFTLITCLLASPIADFYHFPKLKPVLRLVSLYFIFYAFSTVPMVLLTRKMSFSKIAIAGLTSAVLSGITAIWIAKSGAGVWSIIVQYILLGLLNTLLILIFSGWRPALNLKRSALSTLWKFGSRIYYANILYTVVSRLDIFIIGRIFTPLMLGYYSRAQTIDGFTRNFTSASFSSVFFAASAKLQDQRDLLLQLYKRYLHFVSFLSVGLAGLLYLVTPDLFRLLFTEKWDSAADFFQVMCIAGFTWPISSLMVNLIAGTGNGTTYLRLECIRVILLAPVYFFGFAYGIETFLWIMVLLRAVTLSYTAFFVAKEIEIRVGQQLRIILLYIVPGLVATGSALLLLRYFSKEGVVIRMIIMVLVYAFIYLGSQAIIKTHAFRELISFYKKMGNAKKQG